MNIKDLAPNSYTPVSTGLNINNLPKDSYSAVPLNEFHPGGALNPTPSDSSNNQPNYLQNLLQTPQRIWQDYNNAREGIQTAANQGVDTIAKGGVGNFVRGASNIALGTAGNIIGASFAPIGETASALIPKTGNDYVDAATQGAGAGAALGGPPGAIVGAGLGVGFHAVNAAEQWLMQQPKFADFAKNNPDVVPMFNNALNVVASAFGEKIGETKGGDILNRPVEEVPGQIKQNLTNTVKSVGVPAINVAKNVGEGINNIKSSVGEKLQNKFVDQSISDWQKPIDIAKPTYNRANDVFDNASKQGNNIPETLVKNGIKLSDNSENGNYRTSDTADKIRADAGKASADLLRPALQIADKTVPRTSVADVVKATVSDIKDSKGITPGDMEAQITKTETEGKALERKYPNGMSLEDMHDNKITYASNGKYSPVGDTNVNNTAGVNRAFGRTLAGLVESKAPKEIPVHEFNLELQKQYQAADYLDALDGKKVPQSITSKIAKTAAKVTGAAVGHSLGGGILGSVGGYHIGGMIESMVENMPNPIKNYYLDNLSKSNPEAFNQINQYLNQKSSLKGEGGIPVTKNELSHPEIGNIEKINGVSSFEGRSGYGMAKIERDHPEVIPYLTNEIVKNAKITEKLPERTILTAQTEKGPMRIIIDHQLGKEPKIFLNNAYFIK